MPEDLADGYMLQLAEIEAYGTPVCDKSALQAVMEQYVQAGGDESAEAYVKAQAGMENPLLTASSMNVLIRTLKAAFPAPEQSTEQDSAQVTDQVPGGEQESDPAPTPEQGGCGSCKSAAGLGLPALILAAGAVCFKRRKRK